MKEKLERSELSLIEKKLVTALDTVTFLPGSYDKRFNRSLSVNALYTQKQKKYLHFLFNKYRRQIKNYNELAFELDPDRFQVQVAFSKNIFSPNGSAKIQFIDTFKPIKKVNHNK